ncbi:hypothetical protein L9F63_021534, partial [Diploptera punctata]
RQCSICQRYYCTHCLPLGGQNGGSNGTTSMLARFMEKKLKCSKCKVLTARPLCRSQLQQLRVKDLQLYLTSQRVSTTGCVEKDDLVNLLIRHAGGATNSSQRTEVSFGQSSQSDLHSEGQTVSQNLFETHQPGQSFPSTSDSPHSNSLSNAFPDWIYLCCIITSKQGHAPSGVKSESKNNENETSSDHEAAVSSGTSSPDTVHLSKSSSSSSEHSDQVLFAQTSSSSGVDIVEVTDLTEDNSNLDCIPEPIVTVSDDDLSQRRGSAASAMSVSELPPDAPSAPPSAQTDVDNSSMEIEEIIVESSNVLRTSEELLDTIEEETAEEEPIITTQACTGITLHSIEHEDDVGKLTVKQLKELLTLNRVNYRGCCEKPELVEKVTHLWQEHNEAQKALDSMTMDQLCKICMDAPVECVMLECGHMATCTACGKQLNECPICRHFVVRVVRTFRA